MHTPRNIQSPYTASDFWAQWSSVNPRMSVFLKITPQAFWTGVSAIGFTSNTRDMTLPGHSGTTFKSAPGLTPSVLEQALDEAGNLELTGIYQAGSFTRADVAAGKWAYASVEVFSASWENVNLGELVHFKGNLGEVKDYQAYFSAEGRGLIARLSDNAAVVTTRLCRVKDFRDAECGHTASTVTISGTAYNVVQTGVAGIGSASGADDARFVIIFDTSGWAGADPPPVSLFTNGKLTATSGPNAGVSREIAATAEAAGGYPYMAFYLKRGLPYPVETSTTFTLTAGCRRTVEDCRKFGNITRFRGEPYIPGIEAANRAPAAY